MSGVFCFVNVKVTRRSPFESGHLHRATFPRQARDIPKEGRERASREQASVLPLFGAKASDIFFSTGDGEERSRRLGLRACVHARTFSRPCLSRKADIRPPNSESGKVGPFDKTPSRCHQTRSAVQTVRARPIFTTRPHMCVCVCVCRAATTRIGILIQGNGLSDFWDILKLLI